MARNPWDRICGVETEFGCCVSVDGADEPSPEAVVEAIKDHIFYEMKLGAIDLHARDEVFEPAQSGGFLVNGARLYIDAVGSHLEYATAECRSVVDLVANDRAGQRHIVRAIRELGFGDVVDVYNNSVDHFGGHTFGCHENYFVRVEDDFFGELAPMFYAFLVTRQIYAGVGRVGGHILSNSNTRPNYRDVVEHPIDYIWVSQVYGVHPDDSVRFQLSQRADHILKPVASRVRFNRALINPKWEHYYSFGRMHRLHLLFGESNQNEFAYALKVGATLLTLRLLEDRVVPEALQLENPLVALREVSRDPSYRWMVRLIDGAVESAVNVQRRFLELAQRYEGECEQTDWVLREWAAILDGLDDEPLALGDRIDWVAKLGIIEEYRREFGLEWGHDALHSVDMEYHNIDPDKSLFHALQAMGKTRRVCDDLAILDAMTEPPSDTRAKGRGEMVRHVLQRKGARAYCFEWHGAALDRRTHIEMVDPFETYTGLVGQ
jgi:proteasome accessory factor A